MADFADSTRAPAGATTFTTCLYNDPVARAQFHAQGLATVGLDPAWDAAVTAYIAADVRTEAYAEFGPLALEKEAADLDCSHAGFEYGKNWRDTAEGRAIAGRYEEASDALEAAMLERFYRPLWAAQRTLALTPAPSLAATVWKAAAIKLHESWNDPTLERNLAEAIGADLDRVAVAS